MATKLGTHYIGYAQCTNVFHAVRFAKFRSRPLNVLATVDLASLDVANDRAGPVFQDVWARVARWWAYQNKKGLRLGSFDCLAVHENPSEKRHAHWMLHVPDKQMLRLQSTIKNRLAKILKQNDLGDAVHFRKIETPGDVAKYVLKGMNPLYADHFFTNAVDQGFVQGRRISVSRSLGHAARKRESWRRQRRPRRAN